MPKKKLLHISLGNHNTNMWASFSRHFETIHYDWTLKRSSTHALNSEILQIFENFKPDVCFFQLQIGNIISVQTMRKLSAKSITVLWNGDVRSPIPQWEIDLGKVCDISLFTNMHYMTELTKHGVNANFLQVGFDPTIFNDKRPIQQFPKIIFCGSNYNQSSKFPLSADREQMVRLLKQKYKHNFEAYGGGWQSVTGHDQYLNLQQEANAYKNALIGINFSHFNYGRYTSDRLLRMMGSSCFVLSHKYKEIEKDFKIGKHLDVRTSFNELTDKIDDYLNKPGLLKKIETAGYKYVHNTYTWDHFCIKLKKMIGI